MKRNSVRYKLLVMRPWSRECPLCETEKLHVISTSNGDSVPNTLGIDALNTRSIDGPRVSTLRIVGLGALWLAVIVTKNTSLGIVSFQSI
jgi:hypothetical protein